MFKLARLGDLYPSAHQAVLRHIVGDSQQIPAVELLTCQQQPTIGISAVAGLKNHQPLVL